MTANQPPQADPGYDATYVDLAARPDVGDGLRAWRARHFVKQLKATAEAGADGRKGDLVMAQLFDGGMVVTFDRGDGSISEASYVDPDRVRSKDPDTGAVDIGPVTHLIEKYETGFGLVYPNGDKTQRPKGFPDIYKALERTLATQEGQPLANLTDTLTVKMAEMAFSRAIPGQAYRKPLPPQ